MTSLAEAAAGMALVLAFVLLGTARLRTMTVLAAGQAAMVALAIAARHQPIAAAVLFVASAIALPLAILRLPASESDGAARAPAPRLWIVAVGALLVLLCLPLAASALPFALLLIAMLLIATHRHPAMRVIGLLVMQDGVALAASSAGAALPALVVAVLPLVPALALAAAQARASDERRAP